MKRKQVLSAVLTSAMLLSGTGMETTAGTIGQDVQPVVTADTGTGLTFGMVVEENEDESKNGTREKRQEENGKGTVVSEEETEAGMKGETEAAPEEGMEGETEATPEEGTEEKTEAESEKENEKGTGERPGEGTETEAKEESKGDVLFKDAEETSSAVLENPETKLLVELMPSVHKHSWSVDWSYDGTYHWHECSDEECAGIDNDEKDGYGEHTYDDFGVCTGCGYDAMYGIAVAAEGTVPTYQEAYEAMIALEDKYYEGMTWTNYEPYGSKGELGSAYTWKGGPIYGAKSGVGCMAFAFLLSDAAFGSLPARVLEKGKFTFEDVKVGDILRVNGNSHSVIVLKKNAGGVIVAEGNYNKSVHWGRSMSVAEVKNADFIVTRYPAGHVSPDDSEIDEVTYEGMEGDLAWSLTNGGILTLSGNGAIPDYSEDSLPPWDAHEVSIIVIEDGVTSIGDCAFYESEAFRVTIPSSVRAIGNKAFFGCANLVSATVSEGVEIIGQSAFQGCTALTYIDFPASITSVGTAAFMSCKELVSVRFKPGNGSVTLGDNLFAQCWNLTSVTLPRTAAHISAGMFQSCSSLPSLYIPASVQEIGENPFTACNSLKTIYFSGSEEEWNHITNPYLQGSLQSTGTRVEYNAEFSDPFATDPDDPGDFQPGENDSCTNHVDADHDGKCDNCGIDVSSDNLGSDNGNDGDKNPDDSGNNGFPETNGFSGSSSGSGSGNYTVSTRVSQRADGSSVTTKTQRDGTVITITHHAAGTAEVEARLSGLAIETARKNNEAVALPISAVPIATDVSAAQAITVYTQRNQLVKVAIPATSPTAGTVAVIVNGDGSTSVIKGSVVTENCVVAALSDGATIKIVDNAKSFSDVPAAVWYEDAVSFVSARELFYNKTETEFAPGAPLTYGVLATALARFDGEETDGGMTWYEKSMGWAAVHGIANEADPNSSVTCDQLALMLWKYQGSPSAADSPSEDVGSDQMSDVQKAMNWIMKRGIVSGFEEGAWASQKSVNRSQAAQIIMNFAKKSAVNFAR